MAASVEYRAIQYHCATLIETLSRTVDPAQFARRLQGKSMIPEDIVLVASEERVLTRSERMTRVIEAVLAQIKLKDTLFHIFMGLLKEVNLHLWDVINQYYSSSLELNIFKALANVSDWKQLGSHLNISSGKISQLEECGGDIEQCRKEVALEWLKEDKTASWEGLCQALELMGNETEVQAIKERYIFTQCPNAHDEVCDRPDVPSIQERDIAGQVHAFEGRFNHLVFRLQSELSRNAIPMAQFRHSITLLPSTIRTEHYQFILERTKDIRRAEDIEEVFMHLNLYWTYLEYSLLKHIIHCHSTVLSTELKEDMGRYENDIEIFKKCTTMEQLLRVGVGIGCIRREPPPHFSRVVMKLQGNPSDYTLEDIDEVRRKICLAFNLPTFILMLESIDEGSIWITWRIPSSEVHCFRSISQSDMELISADLVYLKCTGVGDNDTAPIETSSSTTGDGAIGGGTTGGGATEGSATGGNATGGSATGGSATGGSATGGSATGGDAARVSRDVAVPLHRRRSDMVLDLLSNIVPSSRTSTPYNPAPHTTPIKAHPPLPVFIGIGGETKQVPATSPAYHQGLLTPSVFSHQVHNSLFKMLNEGTLDRVDVVAINQVLAAKPKYQQPTIEQRVFQLMRAWSDTTALWKNNAALKTELDVSKEMVRLTWSYFQQCRTRVHDEVAPLETQLSRLEFSDDGSCTGEEEPLLSEEVEKLRKDREELEAQVESLTSMHQTALEEMSTYEVEETMRTSERQRLQKEVDYSTLRMRELLTKASTLDQHNQDWEKRCSQFEQRTREQEDLKIVLLKAKIARLKDQAATPLKPAYQRWHSLPLTGSPSSIHPPLHRDTGVGGFEGDSETNEDGHILKKKAGSVMKTSVTLARPGVPKSDSQEECITEDVLAEKYPLEMWFGSIHRVMSHYAMRSHKLRNDAQSLFKRMSSKCEDSSSTPTTPATTTSTPTTPTTTPVLTTQDSPTPTPVPTTPIPTSPASTTSAPSTSAQAN